MTSNRNRNTAFERGRPAPLLAIEPNASARLMLHRTEPSGLSHDLSRWALAQNRRWPIEQFWATMRRSPQLLDEPWTQRR